MIKCSIPLPWHVYLPNSLKSRFKCGITGFHVGLCPNVAAQRRIGPLACWPSAAFSCPGLMDTSVCLSKLQIQPTQIPAPSYHLGLGLQGSWGH